MITHSQRLVMVTAILALVFYVLSLGIGQHVARHVGIYLMLGMASLLPLFIYISIPAMNEQKPVSYFFLSLLGEEQAGNAKLHLLACLGGFVHGVIWQLLRKPEGNR